MDFVNLDELKAYCLGCGKDITDERVYADFSICKDCYVELIAEFLIDSEDYPLSNKQARKKAEEHVEEIGELQEVLIDAMKESMKE